MNVKNLEYLKESMKYLGFGDKLNAELESAIKEQPEKFKLLYPGEFTNGAEKKEVKFVLDFKKSNTTDMYFMNSYQATLKNAEDPTKDVSQTFYINKTANVTSKEAFNLLSGRTVNKDLTNRENQPYNAWLQLDFKEKDQHDNFKVKQFHKAYGYELDQVLAKYPIKEINEVNGKIDLMRSLEKGNLQQVTFVKEGKEEKMYVAANPQFKNLNVYDSTMKIQHQGIEKREKQEPEKSKEQKESVKPVSDDEDSPGKGKKTTKKKGVRI